MSTRDPESGNSASPQVPKAGDSLDGLVRLRLEMWAEGWESDDKLTTQGWGSGLGYSIWFTRWDWHGKKLPAFRASYHAHGLVSDGIMPVAEKAAALAREAWAKFPDEPPNQLPGYSLANGLALARAGAETSNEATDTQDENKR